MQNHNSIFVCIKCYTKIIRNKLFVYFQGLKVYILRFRFCYFCVAQSTKYLNWDFACLWNTWLTIYIIDNTSFVLRFKKLIYMIFDFLINRSLDFGSWSGVQAPEWFIPISKRDSNHAWTGRPNMRVGFFLRETLMYFLNLHKLDKRQQLHSLQQ